LCRRCEAQNLAAPVGRLNGNLDERTIRLQGRLEGPQDFMNLVVAERNGQIVRLGQVADAIDGTQEQRSLALYNGVEAVGINIVKSKGYSTTDVSAKVRKKVSDIQSTLPPGVKIDIVRDAGLRVKASVQNVEEALLIGALLTVLVVFVFLNSWRSTVITGLALPVVGTGVVHSCVGVRIHAQYHVAARIVARDRNSDRRRHRGAREHRAPHRDG